ncbi:methyltransferase domain-containing protein [Leekyejoonella antrihumi]|uniref:methyltransferase domain-containing protein n=1 Tax=Leekyejoonella antrihumi TaxID=1660198 RepID=UPI003CCC6B97
MLWSVDIRHLVRQDRWWLAKRRSELNARHPWSHNDAFHAWIITRLPARRRDALDVGCGCGELVAALAEPFDRVHGLDADADMRQASATRFPLRGTCTTGVGDGPPLMLPQR